MKKLISITCSVSLIFLAVFLLRPGLLQAQNSSQKQLINQVVATVNSHVILKSDVDERVKQHLFQLSQRSNGNVKFSQNMWYGTLQQMVDNYVLLIHARLDSVTVSDDWVNNHVNQQVKRAVSQVGSKAALEQQMGKSIAQLKAKLRPEYKKQRKISKYKSQKLKDIDISRPEVKNFFQQIPKDSIPEVPESVALSQIIVIAPPKKEALKKARTLAAQIRDSIVEYGKSFEEMAKKYSDGPAAPYGGEIPMYPIDDLTPKYAAAASALNPGEVSEVVQTPFGFHIIRLNKRRGNKIDTNNILISLNDSSYNTEAAIKELNQLSDSIQTNSDVTFAEVAKKKSEDPNTAPLGGRILNPRTGSQLLNINQLAPALYRIVLLLNKSGDISKPEPYSIPQGNSTKQAYRIIRLDNHIPKHKENLKQDYEVIKQIALQQKQYKVYQQWLKELKKDVFIDYKIPMPRKRANIAQNK
jgi:peptidyl-prolyl cis-trans isomerase SurA